MSVYEVYRLENPVEQVGLPRSFRWAVGRRTGDRLDFVEAFLTKKGARAYVRRYAPEQCAQKSR